MKIQVNGYSGSGKSTFAKRLSEYYRIPLLHMDTAHFKENWEENDKEIFLNKVLDVFNQDSWVIDGNYSKIVPQRYDECDMLFFFNFNRFKALYGALKRYFKYRNQERESMAKGCKEKFDWDFFKWIMWEGRNKKHKNFYKMILNKCPNHIIFRNRRQVNKYLLTLGIKAK